MSSTLPAGPEKVPIVPGPDLPAAAGGLETEAEGKVPIRVLRVIARLNVGGPAIQAVSLSEALSRDGFSTLLVCGQIAPHEGDMSYLAEEKGIRPHLLSTLGREISALDDLRTLMSLRRIIKEFSPHVIHTHTAKAGTLGRLAGISFNLFRGSRRKIRLVHTFHGHVFHSYFSSLKTFLFVRIERFLARFTDRIIVISPRQEEDICRGFRIAPPEKVSVIPLGFDLSAFRGSREDSGASRTRPGTGEPGAPLRVAVVGRLAPVKNHRMLIEAVKYLKEKGRAGDFRFVVVGDGELKGELEALALEMGVADFMEFSGWQKDMPAVYRTVDIVALTSLNEGTPVTLIEAMAAGKPVVATDVGGVGDLLGKVDKRSADGYTLAQHGILVSSKDSGALAEALLFLLENMDASERMAERAGDFVTDRYSRERLVRDIKGLYRNLVAQSRIDGEGGRLSKEYGGGKE